MQEAAQAQHPLERLGAVADGGAAAPAQLALAQAEVAASRSTRWRGFSRRMAAACTARSGAPRGGHAGRGGAHGREGVQRFEISGELLAGVETEVRQGHAVVAHLLERKPERGPAGAGQEPGADDQLARPSVMREGGAGVRSGDIAPTPERQTMSLHASGRIRTVPPLPRRIQKQAIESRRYGGGANSR